MSFIIPTGWTRHEGYPQIQGNDGGATLTDQFYSVYDLTDVFGKLPVANSVYDTESVVSEIAELRLSSYTVNPTASKNHAMITLTYQPSDSQVATEDNVAEYFLENGTLEKQLSDYPTYLTRWNYHLCKLTGTSQTRPTGWDTATGVKLTETEWKWVKEPSELDKLWVIDQQKTKKGIETFILPSSVVQEKKYYRSKKSANAAGVTVGTLVTPAEVFGIAGGEWLVMSASVQKDNRRYLVERSFQWAENWDDDLYS